MYRLNTMLNEFYELSSTLTGFSRFELEATGVGVTYYETVVDKVGLEPLIEILTRHDQIQQHLAEDRHQFEEEIRHAIVEDSDLGPVARNIIKMWYLGNWYHLDGGEHDEVVSGEAYVEGLVWRALDAHPMGAKPQGYGAWAEKPGRWPSNEGS